MAIEQAPEAGFADTAYPVVVLAEVADSQTRERITRGAAAALKSPGDHPAKEVIRRALRNTIPGFGQRPLLALAPQLAAELNRFLLSNSLGTQQVIRLWISSVPGLAAAIASFVEANKTDERVARLLSVRPSAWRAADLLVVGEMFVTGHPGHERTDSTIGITDHLYRMRLLGEVKGSEKDATTSEGVSAASQSDDAEEQVIAEILGEVEARLSTPPPTLQAPRLSRLLAEFQALPPDASDWDELPDLIAELIRVKVRAINQVEERRAALERRLRDIATSHALALDYMERPGALAHVIVSSHPRQPHALEETEILANNLEAGLTRLGQLVPGGTAVPITMGQDRERLATAQRVGDLLDRIQALTGAGPAPDTSNTQPTEAPEPPATSETQPIDGEPAPTAAAAGAPTAEQVPVSEAESRTRGGAPSPLWAAIDLLPRAKEANPRIEGSAPETTASPAATVLAMDDDPRRIQVAPPAAVAATVAAEGDPDRWKVLVWSLMRDDDLAAAYWMVRSLMARGIDAGIDDDFLAAALGVQFLGTGGTDLALEMAGIISARTPASAPDLLVAHAVAIRGVLIDPSPGFARWLTIPSRLRTIQTGERVCLPRAEILDHTRPKQAGGLATSKSLTTGQEGCPAQSRDVLVPGGGVAARTLLPAWRSSLGLADLSPRGHLRWPTQPRPGRSAPRLRGQRPWPPLPRTCQC